MNYYEPTFSEQKAHRFMNQCECISSQLSKVLGFLENEQLFSPLFRYRASEVTKLIKAFYKVYNKVGNIISLEPSFLKKITDKEMNDAENLNAKFLKDIESSVMNLTTFPNNNEEIIHELTNIMELEKICFSDDYKYFANICNFHSKLLSG